MIKWNLILHFSSDDLDEISNGFAEENFIGYFQFGKVYRGIHEEKPVVVKIWDSNTKYKVLPGENEFRLEDELTLREYFSDHRDEYHPYMAIMIGHCGHYREDKYVGVVYDVNPLDTVHNLLEKDSFTWPERIKVAYKFATLLDFMHAQKNSKYLPYLIRNIDAAHIMLDQDHNPSLFDFSMISGGILFDKRGLTRQHVVGCDGYADPICARPGQWSVKCDVFSYGILLLRMITKQPPSAEDVASEKPMICEWAETTYRLETARKSKDAFPSLLDRSLEYGPFFFHSDAVKITEAAMQCIDDDPQKRPTMKRIVRVFENLKVVQSYDASLTKSKKNANNHQDLNAVRSYMRHKFESTGNSQGPRVIREEHNDLKAFSFDDLRRFTNGFSIGNLIGNFQYGRIYRGKIEDRIMTVKIWGGPYLYGFNSENALKLRDELVLLQDAKLSAHPNLVNLIGYCYEPEDRRQNRFGVVYDLEPLDSLHNLVLYGGLTWLQRIKVAFEFARLLEFLHTPNPPAHLEYLVRNIDMDHIMLDKDFNPKLLDFSMFTGGILPRPFRPTRCFGCLGYMDFYGDHSEIDEVYAYGVVLLSLISGRIYTEEDRWSYNPVTVFDWANEEYKAETLKTNSGRSMFSLVDDSLKGDFGFNDDDGHEITMLAMACIDNSPNRPWMDEVVKRLQKLRAFREHPDSIGI